MFKFDSAIFHFKLNNFFVMGRSKQLTDYERGQIDSFHSMNFTEREIAMRINRSKTAVHNYLSLKGQSKQEETRRRKSSINERSRRSIFRLASNSTITANKIKDDLSLVCSVRTIQREIKSSPNLQHKKLRRKPALTLRHKKQRLDFAKNSIQNRLDWNNIVWSDEKKFNLDGPDGFQYYWHDLRKEQTVLSRRNFGGGNVMVWGAFGSKGKTNIAFVDSTLNSSDYIKVLQEYLLPCYKKICGKNRVFQQDGAAIHTSKVTQNWLKSKNINVLEWPANSPDLNPIENVWGLLVRRVYANGRQFKTKNDLKQKMSECWEQISLLELQKLIDSVPHRLIEVIEKNGGSTHY